MSLTGPLLRRRRVSFSGNPGESRRVLPSFFLLESARLFENPLVKRPASIRGKRASRRREDLDPARYTPHLPKRLTFNLPCRSGNKREPPERFSYKRQDNSEKDAIVEIVDEQKVLDTLADVVKTTIDRGLAKAALEWLGKPELFGTFFAKEEPHSMEPSSLTLEWTVDNYVAHLVRRALPHYVRLYDDLVKQGATCEEDRFDVGSDVYIYAHQHQGDTGASNSSKRTSKVMVLETQNRNYVIILVGWGTKAPRELHIREFWPDIQQVISGENAWLAEDLREAAARKDLTIQDLAKFGASLMRVSDDVEGNYFPVRPSLRTYLEGSLMPGDEKAGLGLQYGDARDPGYVLSARAIGGEMGFIKLEHLLAHGLGSLKYAMSTMAFAAEVVSRDEG